MQIGIVDVDNPARDREASRGCEVHGTHDIVVAVKHFVPTSPKYATKRAYEFPFLIERDRGVDHSRAELAREIIEPTRAFQNRVECPVEISVEFVSRLQHSEKPAFDGSHIEALDNVNHTRWPALRRPTAHEVAAGMKP
jgi:hypothetical protein